MFQNLQLPLLFSLLWIATAHEWESRPAPSNSSLRRAVPNEIRYCSLETCGSAARDGPGSCRRQLSPRVLNAPDPSSHPAIGWWYGPEHYGENVDSFFRGEVAKAYTEFDIVALYANPITSKYMLFEDEPRSLAMLGLCGCIGLIVVSRSAVWMAHIYEDPVLVNQATFDKNGVAVLRGGAGKSSAERSNMRYGLSDLSSDVFAPDKDPVAFVVAPKTQGGRFQYEPLMEKIDQMLQELIGVEPRWVGYMPKRTDNEKANLDLRCSSSHGKVLLQYQPSNLVGLHRRNAIARIWIEGSRTWGTSWPPQSNQMRS